MTSKLPVTKKIERSASITRFKNTKEKVRFDPSTKSKH